MEKHDFTKMQMVQSQR